MTKKKPGESPQRISVRKKPLKTKDITFGIFPIVIEAHIGGKMSDAIDNFCKGSKTVRRSDFSDCKPEPHGRTFMHWDTNVIFLWIYKQDAAVAAHEATHAVFYINEKLGGIFDTNTQETCCYLVEHIVRELMKK